jgi:ubiquinone biosynthesis protein
VLTTSWVDGIPIRDNARIDAAGVDRKALARNLLQAFLQAHRPRRLLPRRPPSREPVRRSENAMDVVAVDFGIMGRHHQARAALPRRHPLRLHHPQLPADRRAAFRDRLRAASIQSIDEFALALRAIGEPQHGRRVSDISMAKVLGQLFATTELFEMQTRPELILLQKSMVLVEGVARTHRSRARHLDASRSPSSATGCAARPVRSAGSRR